ncbi:MAG: FG-GAP repeat protein [Planctomycetota bacterium]|jgi:hypothetical protein
MFCKSLDGKCWLSRLLTREYRITVAFFLLFSVGSVLGNGELQTKMTAPLPDPFDRYGYAVDMSDTHAIVGAYDNGSRGVVYIYSRSTDSNDPNWFLQDQIAHAPIGEAFGEAVSIDGDWAIVGARDEDSNGLLRGAAYMIHWDGANWVEQQRLEASDKSNLDSFGYSVSISGNYAIVGAYLGDKNGGPSDSGTAYIFHWDGLSWNEKIELSASDAEDEDHFGNSVSIDGNYAIIGAYFDDDNGYGSGSAYIFKRDGNEPNNWSEQAKIMASDGSDGAAFGCSVSLDGDYAIAGAFGQDSGGAAYVFKRDGASWPEQ